MVDWVWAIDEDGKPCKCTAKPENRGKRNCKHRFHAAVGESQKDFFKKFGVSGEQAFTTENNIEVPDITMEDLPDYNDKIKELINVTDNSSNDLSSIVEDTIYHNSYVKGGRVLEGVDVKFVKEEQNGDYSNITVSFTEEDGTKFERAFSIPKMNDNGEYIINGVAYRYIPTFEKNKLGINVSDNAVFLKDEYEHGVVKIYGDNCKIFTTDENGKTKWENASINDLDSYFKDGSGNLTDNQKKAVSSMSPVFYERYKELGLDGIRQLPPDDINDITDRRVITYKDRVGYVLSKTFLSMESHRKKAMKNGKPYDFKMDNVSDNINKTLVNSSYMQTSDNLNPIAAISQAQRVSWTGAGGGWNSNNVPEKLRRTHQSYFGTIDPSDVSLGGKIGLTVAVKGRVNKNGVLEKDDSVITCSDFIPYKENCDPNRASMAISQMKEACPIIGGEDPKCSTPGWDRIKGSKLGVNLNTAYLPEKGVWEDAVVISESTAKKMATVQTRKYHVEHAPENIKIGQKVERGDRIGSVEIRYPGKIKSVSGNTVEIESVYTMGVGDKVAGRSGNKGVVSRIVPDNEMPKVNGKPADIIMSPIGVAGRSNLGQIYEVNNGDFNKKSKIEYNGHTVEGTGGEQFIMRINQIAEKKILSNTNKMTQDRNYRTRWGEMEQLIMSTNEDRLEILDYVKHQEYSDVEHKLEATLHAVGVDLKAIN